MNNVERIQKTHTNNNTQTNKKLHKVNKRKNGFEKHINDETRQHLMNNRITLVHAHMKKLSRKGHKYNPFGDLTNKETRV